MLHGKDDKNSFYCSILYAIRFYLTKKRNLCINDEIRNDISANSYVNLFNLKESLVFDLIIYNFERQCFEVNEIVFLRVFEIKKKVIQLIHTNSNQNKVKIEFSSCDVEKFSGFIILRNSRENKTRQEFVLINIVYQPGKHFKQKINCYFTNMLSSIQNILYYQKKR